MWMDELEARLIGVRRAERGIELRRGDEPLAWLPGAWCVAWSASRRAMIVVYERGAGHEPPLPPTQRVERWSMERWERESVIEVEVPLNGCSLDAVAISPSGRWAVTRRSSGQGECGFDLMTVDPLARVAGISDRRGYMLAEPRFDATESTLVIGYGPWLGGWWVHPDDYPEDPSRGGVMPFGSVVVIDLGTLEQREHRLEVEVPRGFLPDDAEPWDGPTEIELVDGELRMRLPGGDSFVCAEPLPSVVRIPAWPALLQAAAHST